MQIALSLANLKPSGLVREQDHEQALDGRGPNNRYVWFRNNSSMIRGKMLCNIRCKAPTQATPCTQSIPRACIVDNIILPQLIWRLQVSANHVSPAGWIQDGFGAPHNLSPCTAILPDTSR